MHDWQTVTNTLEFPYRRSLGSVVGGFAEALREQRIVGSVTAEGRVLVPPLEYDPDTGDAVRPDLVDVGPGGVVTAWTWVSEPTSRHPLQHPFAFALIRLDGADTALAHVVDAASPDKVSTGMRVVPRFGENPTGWVTDIEAFVAEGSA
jgi:uncharacterized OB-fold protein